MPEISETGLFFDTRTNKVVDSPPEEGVQIVAPGGALTDDVMAEEKRWREMESGSATVDEAVTSEAAAPKRAASKKDSE